MTFRGPHNSQGLAARLSFDQDLRMRRNGVPMRPIGAIVRSRNGSARSQISAAQRVRMEEKWKASDFCIPCV